MLRELEEEFAVKSETKKIVYGRNCYISTVLTFSPIQSKLKLSAHIEIHGPL